jgi:hypothetical protein
LARISIVELQSSLSFPVMMLLLVGWFFNRPLLHGMGRLLPQSPHRWLDGDTERSARPSPSLWAIAVGVIPLIGVSGAGVWIVGVPDLRTAVRIANDFLWASFYTDVSLASAEIFRSISSRDFFATILFLGLACHALLKRGPFWACLVLIPTFQVLATGSCQSMSRVLLAAFPAFIDIAEIASKRTVFVTTIIGSLIVQVFLLKIYVNALYFVA